MYNQFSYKLFEMYCLFKNLLVWKLNIFVAF